MCICVYVLSHCSVTYVTLMQCDKHVYARLSNPAVFLAMCQGHMLWPPWLQKISAISVAQKPVGKFALGCNCENFRVLPMNCQY